MINKGLFSSKTCDWETPIAFFKALDERYHFTLDVCATQSNAKCKDFFSPEQDGLSQTWTGSCWMNPPYGREIGKWVKKAYESVAGGGCDLVCCLLPARTDTAWWHDYAMRGEITFIRGRLKFGGCKNSATFPSAVCLFTRTDEAHALEKELAMVKRERDAACKILGGKIDGRCGACVHWGQAPSTNGYVNKSGWCDLHDVVMNASDVCKKWESSPCAENGGAKGDETDATQNS